ncbi:MAG: transketolase C-terminal domain-containing protein [bacterium]
MTSDKYLPAQAGLIPEWRTAEKKAIRVGMGEGLVELGAKHDDIVVLTADLGESTKVRAFAEAYPDKFLDVGVAEQNMIGVAAGIANEGFVPFAASYATFSPGRNWEQIRVSVCLSNANVKIIGSHAGVSSGLNGPSHQGTEDIAMTRVLPNMVVIVPADANQAMAAVEAAYNYKGPVYLRTTRPDTPNFTKPMSFEIGRAYIYREGKDLTICACGIQVWDALMVAEQLAIKGIECEVINVSSIKPIDKQTILTSVKKTGKVVTMEDHQIMGGMGSAIAELLAEENPTQIKFLGIRDRFGLSGKFEEVYQKVGLDRSSLEKAVIDWFHYE